MQTSLDSLMTARVDLISTFKIMETRPEDDNETEINKQTNQIGVVF